MKMLGFMQLFSDPVVEKKDMIAARIKHHNLDHWRQQLQAKLQAKRRISFCIILQLEFSCQAHAQLHTNKKAALQRLKTIEWLQSCATDCDICNMTLGKNFGIL
jgi:hypothetical protein